MKVVFAFVLISLIGSLAHCKTNVAVVDELGNIELYAAHSLRNGSRAMQMLKPQEGGEGYKTVMRYRSYMYTWEKTDDAGFVRRWHIDEDGKLLETRDNLLTSQGPIFIRGSSDDLIEKMLLISPAGKSVRIMEPITLQTEVEIKPEMYGNFQLEPVDAALTAKYLYVGYSIPELEREGIVMQYDVSQNYTKVNEARTIYITHFEIRGQSDLYTVNPFPPSLLTKTIRRWNPETLEVVAEVNSPCVQSLVLSEDLKILYVGCDSVTAYDIADAQFERKCESDLGGTVGLILFNNRLFSSGEGVTQYSINTPGGCPLIIRTASGVYQGMLGGILY
ncbi:hypothetical protein NDN08_005348 [Rhodosorus marinus]|uniref:ER membrane protein complex subunit 1 n=1 Tax=Rhodosorus marinus TaxID=101924 RepID=A0AAV8V1A9_9RHOD|nr:hypothetical protein NDN08_005348 [Rhodosorus marinus]